MEKIVAEIIPFVPSAAWPVILVVALYLWINKQRKETKVSRDVDSQNIHDKLLTHQWEINALKHDVEYKDKALEDLKAQVNTLNKMLAIVSTKLDGLTDAIRELKERT